MNVVKRLLIFFLLFTPFALSAQQTLVPVSATIEDAQGSYTSENFDSPNMTVYDYGNSVSVVYAGDKIPLIQSAYDRDAYSQSATQGNTSVRIVAHRDSRTRKIFMVTLTTQMSQGKIKIVFKEKRNFNLW